MNEIGNQSRVGSPIFDLIFHVMREVRKRIALRLAAFRGNFFVAAR